MVEFKTLMENNNTDIAAVCEFWYNDELPDNSYSTLCSIPGYQFISMVNYYIIYLLDGR